ncbi:hypothetical protein, partial [Lacticaseibacillus rhamnosus]|uniref:hypothetical protein n=1 Tax=Lacticaseibacillus rhamnosus TaxID=47715 RepID=UPI003F470A70
MTGRTTPAPSPILSSLRLRLACACALAALAGACKAEPPVTGAIGPSDYRARHPIVLADGTR